MKETTKKALYPSEKGSHFANCTFHLFFPPLSSRQYFQITPVKGGKAFCFCVRKKINCCLAKKRRRGQVAFHPRRRNESEDCARACGRAGVRVGGLHAGGRASKLRAKTTSTVSSRSKALFQRSSKFPYGQMCEGDFILRPGSPLVLWRFLG